MIARTGTRENQETVRGAEQAMVGAITKKFITSLVTTEKPIVVWERELPRFGVKVSSTAKSYVVQYRVKGRLRRYTIGRHGERWSPDTARREAHRVLGLVANGQDPAEAKQADRVVPTVRELATRFLA